MVASCVTIALVDAWVVAAITAAAPTSAMPIMSAPAVFAVRRGLRITLPRASRPTGRHRTNGQASTPEGPAREHRRRGEHAEHDARPRRRRARAPAWSAVGSSSATHDRGDPGDHRARRRRPRGARSERSGSATSSRIASTGGTSAARRAGSAAASTLTSVPTSTETTSVNPSSGTSPGELHARTVPSTPREHHDEPEPARDAERRAEHPDDRGLQHDRGEHLQRRRPDGAQQRELAHPLPHPHRERVGDDEAADEQRDPGEDQQERRDEPERP